MCAAGPAALAGLLLAGLSGTLFGCWPAGALPSWRAMAVLAVLAALWHMRLLCPACL